jgi:hypothetical protein
MYDHASNGHDAVANPPVAAVAKADPTVAALEFRVQRLEEAVASLQDNRLDEERLLARVSERLQSKPTKALPATAEPIAAAERRTAPPANPTFPLETALTLTGVMSQRWLIFDLIEELRTVVRMFFDMRYAVTWTTRLMVLILLPLILLVDWWLPFAGVPLIGPLLSHLVILILALVLYKALSRETKRYVQVRAGMNP